MSFMQTGSFRLFPFIGIHDDGHRTVVDQADLHIGAKLAVLDFSKADVTVQPAEVIDFTFASWEDIEKLSKQGVFLHFERLRTALGKA